MKKIAPFYSYFSWWFGYIERKDNVYFFATGVIKKVELNNPNFSPCRKEITKKILKELKLVERLL